MRKLNFAPETLQGLKEIAKAAEGNVAVLDATKKDNSLCACCQSAERKLYTLPFGSATCRPCLFDTQWYLRDRRETGSMANNDPSAFERVKEMLRSGNSEMQALANNGEKR